MLIIQQRIVKRQITSVWLEKNHEEPSLFHCTKCQCPEFKYQGFVAMMIDGDAPMQFPLEFYCKNKTCPRIYRIEGFVY